MVQARAKYLSVARQMKEYEDQKYAQWREHVEQVLPGLLKRNLLVRPPAVAETLALTQAPAHQPRPPTEEKPRSSSTRRSAGNHALYYTTIQQPYTILHYYTMLLCNNYNILLYNNK